MQEHNPIENHTRYLERMALHRQHGYDVEEERRYIIEKARPLWGNILEGGTGKGYFTLALAREGFSFTTFDISGVEQHYARLNLAYQGLAGQVRFDVADLERLPYPDASYDVIFAVNMIHHLRAVKPACRELTRILSPAGKMVLADFNENEFAVIDKIHALEGRRHERNAGTIGEAKAILLQWNFKVDEHPGANQDILVAQRKT